MPEDFEVDSEDVRKVVDEELEREGGSLLKRIALTTAILAAFAAVASLNAGDTANEALALKTEAAQIQAQASDAWAYYQTKGLKASLEETARQAWLANKQEPPPQLTAFAQHYASEQSELEQRARTLEQERDVKNTEAAKLLRRHHRFAYAVTLFQIAIALSAIAALTRTTAVWLGSLAVGLVGIFLFTSWL